MKALALAMFFSALSILSFSQHYPYVVKDANTEAKDGDVALITAAKNSLYFISEHETGQQALWKTDGTKNNTQLINLAYSINHPFAFGDSLLFRVNNKELWLTDGSAMGTKKLADVIVSSGGVTLNNICYFIGQDSKYGKEIWRTDGTDTGTYILRDINVGSGPSNPNILGVFDGKLFFTAYTSTDGTELWVSDGTHMGTKLFKSFSAGSASSTVYSFTKFDADGKLYFAVRPSGQVARLWKTDGTAANTELVFSTQPNNYGYNPGYIMATDTALYFTARIDGSTITEIWKTDGTATGTRLISNLDSLRSSRPTELIDAGNGRFFFNAMVPGRNTCLHVSDCTRKGTGLVKELYPQLNKSDWIDDITVLDSFILFEAREYPNEDDLELYISKGDSSNTFMLKDIRKGTEGSSPSYLAHFKNRVFFSANDGVNGNELWVTDGTDTGTYMFFDPYPGTNGANITNVTSYNKSIVYNPEVESGVRQIWQSRGAGSNTYSLNLSFQNDYFSLLDNFIGIGDYFYFQHSAWVFQSDGTRAGTKELDVNSNFEQFFPTKSKLFFTKGDVYNRELYSVENGKTKTQKLLDLDYNFIYNSSSATNYGNRLLMAAEADANGIELWETNGTKSKTFRAADIESGAQSSTPSNITLSGSVAYFDVYANGKSALWYYNFRNSKAQKIIDFGAYDYVMAIAPDSNGGAYFTVSVWGDGNYLYHTNGNKSGTKAIKKIEFPDLKRSVVTDSNIYFSARDDSFGNELWVSDGTATGTKLLKDINNGKSNSLPTDFTLANNKIYFSADDGIHGVELWETDGTSAGTKLVEDIKKGPLSSNPKLFTLFNDTLYFVAENSFYGEELHALNTFCLKSQFKTSKNSYCLGDSVVFTNESELGVQSNVKYNWLINGNSVGNKKELKYAFDSATTHTIKLVVSSENCNDTYTQNLEIFKLPEANFTIDKDSQCLDENKFIFRNTTQVSNSAITQEFEIGSEYTSKARLFEYSFTKPGKYEIFLNVSGGSCKSTKQSSVWVFEMPTNDSIQTSGTASKTNTFWVAYKQGIYYNWSVKGGDILGGTDTNLIVVNWSDTIKVGEVALIKSNEFGCKSDSVKKVIDLLRVGNNHLEPNLAVVYPNPAHNFIIVSLADKAEITTHYEIIDVSGRIIKIGIIRGNKHKIDVSSFNESVVFLKLQNRLITKVYKVCINE
ncbi:MAG: ELWxxDGT repeat protein [Bacteroidia bacterium]